jgi:hypothetical protein
MNAPKTAAAETDCDSQPLLFQDLGPRKVVADFSAGTLSSDAGALLLRQVDQGLGVSRALAACFCDRRDPRWVEHEMEQLCAQRLIGLALGYEDLNDHAALRRDPLLAVAVGKIDPTGQDRIHEEDRGAALACPATLNRMELSNHRNTRRHKLGHDPQRVERCLLMLGARCLPKQAEEIVLDLDGTGMLLHGEQEGRFFSAYYGDYCYQPLYIFAGNVPLWAQLRSAEGDGAAGALEAVQKVVAVLRGRCPEARIILRADSGFCRDGLMSWCEEQTAAGRPVYYCLGLAQNARLLRQMEGAMASVRARQILCGGVAVRQFVAFEYRTLEGWSRSRRVVGKAEVTRQGDNPRFVASNLPPEGFCQEDRRLGRFEPAGLYEGFYCARGQMENVLKQQLLDLKADRLSTHHMGSNQLRLWFSALAYLLLDRLRAFGLAGTQLARATVGSVRLNLLKLAGEVRVSVRRVWVRLSAASPVQGLFRRCHARLMAVCWDSS